ncbi:MAG: high-potential iron-sulfur protein [Leptonema sp. (in: bacteria)]
MKLENKKISRKDFIATIGVVGIGIALGGNLIANEKCGDVSKLTAEEKKHRESLKYTDKSPEAGKTCDNCALYVPPKGNSPCGACNLVKGPIHPKGWCTSWVKKG